MRPIPKWALYTFKLLATLTTTVIVTGVFTALTYAAIYAGDRHPPEHLALRCLKAASIHSLAVIAYCCLFGLISLLTRRTLIVGIVYAALIEGVLANLPLSVRLLTVIYYARIIAYRTLTFLAPTPIGPQDMAAEAWQLDVGLDPKLAEHPSVRAAVGVLLLASLACTVLAALACSNREFHVKTPEKAAA
jgi:hypothetical protein